MKPIHRSKLRLLGGKLYYYMRRQVNWYCTGKKYARSFGNLLNFPVVVYHHETPLIRNLPLVDMKFQLNKITNLRIAIQRLNYLTIFPGEIFSFWFLVGKPTRLKGYLQGFVLNQGKIKSGIGGGICQLTNLIYWMTLHTPLSVIERWRHSYDVFPDTNRMIPFGSGATCSYPSLDLQIMNNSTQPFQLYFELSDTHLIGEWRSIVPFEHTYRVYEAFHEISADIWGHYIRHNTLRRQVFNRDNIQINDEFITENHAIMMYQPFLTKKPDHSVII